MMKVKTMSKKMAISLICLLLIGCSLQSAKPTALHVTPTHPEKPEVSATNALLHTPTPTVPKIIEASPTYESLPIAIPNRTSIPTPTGTSILPEIQATLTQVPDSKRIRSLFSQPICYLPCWWGIVPGQTSWEDAYDLFNYLGLPLRTRKPNVYTMHEVKIGDTNTIYGIQIQIYEKDNVVDYISVRSYLTPADFVNMYRAYEPKEVLETLGTPSRIYVFASLLGNTSYELDLFYDEIGLFISYGGSTHKVSGTEIEICPDFSYEGIRGMGIYMQANHMIETIDHFPDEELQTSRRERESYLRTVKSAAGLTNEDFRNLFVGKNKTYCFTISQ
jgi:hypothetical protein